MFHINFGVGAKNVLHKFWRSRYLILQLAMPSNKHKCSPCVKTVINSLYSNISYPKCNTSKSKVFRRSILNWILEVSLFVPAKMYIIC